MEQWPLLQSFALDNVFKSTGFFTARYTVADVTVNIEVGKMYIRVNTCLIFVLFCCFRFVYGLSSIVYELPHIIHHHRPMHTTHLYSTQFSIWRLVNFILCSIHLFY
ncbi:hypothetical protein EON65_39325 [archaeon]|nr:MAG: hypothetical protein EON65_39325 [archaeon]